ncbi:MAG: hypothetical protein Q613_PSC00271G0001, partial [Propionibacterium sp. DORA_15]
VDVDPVANIETAAVELGASSLKDFGDLTGDELLDVLAWAIVVRAVRDGGLDSE